MTPGDVDAEVVRRHLLALDHAMQELRKHQGRPIDLLDSDLEERWIVERGLQLCTQNALDVATHIAAATGHDVPDYAVAIDCLGEEGVLPAAFAARFRGLAGFRNVLVHGYLNVDIAILHQVLNEELDDLAEFARHVDEYLGEQGRRSSGTDAIEN